MRPSKLVLVIGFWPMVACLALQDVPTRGEGKDCEADDWCDDGLVCLRESAAHSLGVCAKRGTCKLDENCAPNQLCQGASYDARGTCQPNTGCTSNAQCSAGLSCFRGACYEFCTSTSMCDSSWFCLSLGTTPLCPVLEECPDVCRPL